MNSLACHQLFPNSKITITVFENFFSFSQISFVTQRHHPHPPPPTPVHGGINIVGHRQCRQLLQPKKKIQVKDLIFFRGLLFRPTFFDNKVSKSKNFPSQFQHKKNFSQKHTYLHVRKSTFWYNL